MFKDFLSELYVMFFSNEYIDEANYQIFDEMFEEQLKTQQLKDQIKEEILSELKNN